MVSYGYKRKIGTMGLWLALAGLAVGCAAPKVIQSRAPEPAVPQTAPLQAKAEPAAYGGDGSLWVDDGSLSEMFINTKAHRVGDIVTIKIVENSKATNKATTKTDRTTDTTVGLTEFFGLEKRFPSTSNFFNPFSPVTSEYSNAFDGSGSTARSGALTAYISARIIHIRPNGNLIIEGNREVRVNHENQIITLTGEVRPRDISPDNIVQSTYIADARISYSGSGVLNDQQRPGWLARILDNIWPF
ncbi:MAG: flagellar basal body L-ring protein FlgH [Desulfobacteraceae bacterium]|jgi:flagellar L-ring protein precursor FlgH